jgi:hypothetical protein
LASKLRESNVTPPCLSAILGFGSVEVGILSQCHQLGVKKEGKVTQTSISGFYM